MKTAEWLHKDITLCGKNVPIKWILIGIMAVVGLAVATAISGCTVTQEDGQNRSLVKANFGFSIMEGSSTTRVAAGGNTDKIAKIYQDPNGQPSLRKAEVEKAHIASTEAIRREQIKSGEPVTSKERTKDKAMDKGLVANVKDVLD